MALPGASFFRGVGVLKEGYAVALEYTIVNATGVVTLVNGYSGFSLGTFTSGVATLSFPKNLKFLRGFGGSNTDSANATSRHDLAVNTVSLTAGTATVRSVDQNDGTTETPATGTIWLLLVVAD